MFNINLQLILMFNDKDCSSSIMQSYVKIKVKKHSSNGQIKLFWINLKEKNKMGFFLNMKLVFNQYAYEQIIVEYMLQLF